MAHAAEIDENGIVLRVLVVNDEEEHRIQDHLAIDLGLGGTWVQTSYNGRIRKNYAGIGFKYDAERDAFIPPKPFESWILHEDTCNWISPVELPSNDKGYTWDEETISWKELTIEESGE
jgi:hypothetical protein